MSASVPRGFQRCDNEMCVAHVVPILDIHESKAGNYCSSCCGLFTLDCAECWGWDDDDGSA